MRNFTNGVHGIIEVKDRIDQFLDCYSFTRGEGLSSEKLKNEHDFVEYLKLLKKFAQRYCIFVNSCDTPWGPAFTQEITQLMMDIGFKIDLYGKFRCAYVAAIDAGELIFEKIEEDTNKAINITITTEQEDEIKILSAGFGSYEYQAGFTTITINGTEYSMNARRGLGFVVYDKVTKNVLDSVSFDSYEDFRDIRADYRCEGLKKYIKDHPGVNVIEYNVPKFPDENLTANEQFIINNAVTNTIVEENFKKHVFAINRYYDDEVLSNVFAPQETYYDLDGVRRFEDRKGKYLNIIGGHRVTAYQPESFERKLYVYGICHAFGYGATDECTIPSQLQKLFNEKAPQYKVIVQNYGYICGSFSSELDDALKIIGSLPVKPGDIILFYSDSYYTDNDIPKIDIKKSSHDTHDFEMFFDPVHFTPDGYRVIAEKIFDGLLNMGIFNNKNQDLDADVNDYGFDFSNNIQLAEYQTMLNRNYNIEIGSIVMNCNPFTLGHRYLIEKALEKCDFLMIFVVEEDKSLFTFEERLMLIKEGTKDLKNVKIIASGKFIISSLTFSGYFCKSELQDKKIDASLDINIFADKIAPCLNIKKRFAGEEPTDNVTRQYNQAMRNILPEHGIEFVEIPRLESDGEAISASKVRKLYEDKDFEALKKLVPETTLKYLISKFQKV
ncbi:MAG: adenylyltransferase/cytidyltransferase family protein [Clostridium sp.]|nr:adenylyltransferase/cytidyltransferase family protein [Clostridium sp.]